MADFNFYKDNDQLDMNGEWDIYYRSNEDPAFTFPPGYTAVYQIKLKASGDPKTGQTFRGSLITPGKAEIEFAGKTIYRKRGRQILQMTATFPPEQWVQEHAGQHNLMPAEKGTTEIRGVAIDCGGPLGPLPEGIAPRTFKMVRVRPK